MCHYIGNMYVYNVLNGVCSHVYMRVRLVVRFDATVILFEIILH